MSSQLLPTTRRLVTSITETSWSCRPNRPFVYRFVFWMSGFVVVSGIAIASVSYALSATMLSGIGKFFLAGNAVLLMVIIWAVFAVWSGRNQCLKMDAHHGTISLGDKVLCRIADVYRIFVVEDLTGDIRSFTLNVQLNDGKPLKLPPWIVALPFDEAETVSTGIRQICGLDPEVNEIPPELRSG